MKRGAEKNLDRLLVLQGERLGKEFQLVRSEIGLVSGQLAGSKYYGFHRPGVPSPWNESLGFCVGKRGSTCDNIQRLTWQHFWECAGQFVGLHLSPFLCLCFSVLQVELYNMTATQLVVSAIFCHSFCFL